MYPSAEDYADARKRWLSLAAQLERLYGRELTEEERKDWYRISCEMWDEVRAAEAADLELWFSA
jgi:hypothetical protein